MQNKTLLFWSSLPYHSGGIFKSR